ncbi:3382_t:CDS:2 [Entrophospora sp. SA101]|nr:14217_t:CDS:2 [Entrophospora sp. SA101]CAJ0747564.1 3382_t:CDS:2 [Entrophospora sp. SA101]CAJ0850490.1 11226_t:CDS:2 [Entrophospora sp. SA101]CAJ0892870.1 5812_t:CDS:2 [Entrophospora sp. SA101]
MNKVNTVLIDEQLASAEKGTAGVVQPINRKEQITGILTSRIETKRDKVPNKTYHYGFFKLETQNQEIPVVFKEKPEIPKGSKLEELKELEKFSQLGEQYLKAHLLTKSARYANYQSEYLEQAKLNQASYLARIASELEITKRQMLATANVSKSSQTKIKRMTIETSDLTLLEKLTGNLDILMIARNPKSKPRRSPVPRNLKTQAQLQAEINRLKAENQQFRLVFRIIIETAYQVVNKEPEPETKEANHE